MWGKNRNVVKCCSFVMVWLESCSWTVCAHIILKLDVISILHLYSKGACRPSQFHTLSVLFFFRFLFFFQSEAVRIIYFSAKQNWFLPLFFASNCLHEVTVRILPGQNYIKNKHQGLDNSKKKRKGEKNRSKSQFITTANVILHVFTPTWSLKEKRRKRQLP